MDRNRTHGVEEFFARFPAIVALIRRFREIERRLPEALLRSWLSRKVEKRDSPVYLSEAEYQSAVDFRKTFQPKTDRDYAWVIEFAKDSYKELDETFTYLDEKADSIIKYMGGGTAVIAIGSLITINQIRPWFLFFLLPSFGYALRSIYLAVQARRPTTRPNPTKVTTAIEFAEAYEKEAEPTFLGVWHECCEGLAIVNKEKSKKVDRAHRDYYRALFCLLLPLIGWPLWTMLSPQASKPTKVEIVNEASYPSPHPAKTVSDGPR
jgi:hypothetical protein